MSQGRGDGKSLYLPLKFAVSFKLLLKSEVLKKIIYIPFLLNTVLEVLPSEIRQGK